jgi:hypothetical protein
MDPPDKASDAEQYQLLQAAAQIELCRRAIGREPDGSDLETMDTIKPRSVCCALERANRAGSQRSEGYRVMGNPSVCATATTLMLVEQVRPPA